MGPEGFGTDGIGSGTVPVWPDSPVPHPAAASERAVVAAQAARIARAGKRWDMMNEF